MKIALTLAILILGAATIMAEEKPSKEIKWYSGKVQYEGSPMHLRFPEKPDFDSLQGKYPKLLIVTHTLEVKSSGEPKPDYNDSLAEFDHELINVFSVSSNGIPVLVETFGGRRNYYFYTSGIADIEDLKKSYISRFPQHRLEWKQRDDVNWTFIRRYSADFKFYEKKDDRRRD